MVKVDIVAQLVKLHTSQILNVFNKKNVENAFPCFARQCKKKQVEENSKKSIENTPVANAIMPCVPTGHVFQFHWTHSISLKYTYVSHTMACFVKYLV